MEVSREFVDLYKDVVRNVSALLAKNEQFLIMACPERPIALAKLLLWNAIRHQN